MTLPGIPHVRSLDGVIECPFHQGRFHIPSDRAKSPPVCVDLKTYPVKPVDGQVYIWA
jgi:3-phenylpropionate/trans-cinnamate dioxygenase ferredoxin subunit